jgi:hypothetical protein
VYINVDFSPNPVLEYQARRMAYAYITPADAPCRAEPCPFIRLVFRTLALDLPQTFELRQVSSHGADVTMRFRTPDDREAAMRRQPFVLDGATVKLLRDGETPDVRRVSNSYIVHAALRHYPVEQRTRKKIEGNCNQLGHVREIDPACFAGTRSRHRPCRPSARGPWRYRPRTTDRVPRWLHQRRPRRDCQDLAPLTLLRRRRTVRAHLPGPGCGGLMDLAPLSVPNA